MSRKKRWEDVYDGVNPFELPQKVARGVRQSADKTSKNGTARIKYLWIYVSTDGLMDTGVVEQRLSADEWLGVIDESAAMGAECVIISVGDPLTNHPEVVEICKWAQEAHGMMVGVHIYQEPLTAQEVSLFESLSKENTHLFVDPDCLEKMPHIYQSGLPVHDAMGQDQEEVSPSCHLPEEMACVGSGGTMYTCGLVLGNERFRMGNFYDRQLGEVMQDTSVPHTVPEGTPKTHHKCNGCPPLMVQRMQQCQAM